MNADTESDRLGRQSSLDKAQRDAIAHLSTVNPENFQEVAASQIAYLQTFYDLVLGQAKRSFRWALIASAIGLLFFLAAISFLLLSGNRDIAAVSVISGALIQVIAGLNFFLYGRTSSQLSVFHSRLEITQRFLLANSLCEGLDDDRKGEARASLINKLASIALAQITSQSAHEGGKGA